MEAEVPENDTYADRHIERVLSAELRDFQTEVCSVDNILTHSRNLISEYDCIAFARLRNELVEHDRTDGLFCTYNGVSFFLQTTDSVHRVVDMFPCHTVFRTEGRFMDFCRWGHCADSAKPDLVDLE